MDKTIIERIRKLLNHAESSKALGSLEEATAYLKMATRLMFQYRIDRETVESQQQDFKVVKEVICWETPSGGKRRRRRHWVESLCQIICDKNGCVALLPRGFDGIIIAGEPVAAALTRLICVRCVATAEKLADQAYRAAWTAAKSLPRDLRTQKLKGIRSSFVMGFVGGVLTQYNKMRDNPVDTESSTAMVLLKNDVIRVSEAIQLDKVKPAKNVVDKFAYNAEALQAGLQAGLTIDLKGPVTPVNVPQLSA